MHISGLLLSCFLLLSACNRKEEQHQTCASPPEELETTESEPLEAPDPLSIEGLRSRVLPELEIELLNAIASVEGLDAWEFTYNSDGHTIYGLLEKPAGTPPPNGWPVIIIAHGYIPPEVYLTSDNRRHYRSVTQVYAKGGFLVLKPDYRGHGRSEGTSEGPTATIDYSIDVLNLISQIESVPDADPSAVFLYGHSMGGEITLRILTVNKTLRGATLWAPVSKRFPENMLYFIRKDRPEEIERFQSKLDALYTPDEYDMLTPNDYLDSVDIPILLHHGTQDESVPFEWSTELREVFDKAGLNYTFYEYPGDDHNLSNNRSEVVNRDMDFFKSLME